MDISIRGIENEELEGFIRTCEAAFSWDVHPNDMKSMKAVLETDRCWVAEEGSVSVGTGANYSFELTIPGARIPAAGLTMVGVLPSHRRRGVLTSLMREFLADPRKRGEAVSILWASESVIYQRFGYGCASLHQRIKIERGHMRFIDDPGPQGSARFIDIKEAFQAFAPVYEKVRAVRPGTLARSETWWKEHRLRDHEHDRDGGSPLWCVLVETDGEPSAYALYRVHQAWPDGVSRSRLAISEAMWTTPRAARELWRFLFGVDLIETVEAYSMPLDNPLPLMVTDPRRISRTVQDNLWLRVVDVPGALEARGYATDGRLKIGVTDRVLPDNDGVWELDASGDNATCKRSDGKADIWLDIADLGAVYLGGTRPASLASAGRIDARDEEAVRSFDAMMAPDLLPWYGEIF